MLIASPRNNPMAQDLIAVLREDDFRQVLTGSDIMAVSVRQASSLPSYATELGEQITDHAVFEPTEIELPFMLTIDTRNLYEELKRIYVERQRLIVQTRVDSFSNMVILEIPHYEDRASSISINVRLRQVTDFTPEYGDLPPRRVANPAQASTVKTGAKQTRESDAGTKRKASILRRIID